ncbi:YiaA/YiaB family inner membrane protein [Amycolatopsis sp. NPDC058986]|uniref:YiaA/YiaB family inner membrane protein n=1 Tax=unclassified Amycolatopsis TaxID=2618356 RepID=UPI00366B1D7D
MTKTVSSASSTTAAFFAQAALSFGLALVAVSAGIVFLPVNGWVRGFLALGMLYLVTSAFTLAKCVRDRQDENSVVTRVDQARLDKLLAEHDPFKTPAA